MSHQDTHRVDIIIYPGFQVLEAVAPLVVFDHANALLKQLGRRPCYTVQFVSTRLGQIPSDSIMQVEATRLLDASDLPDVALVVGTRTIQASLTDEKSLIRWLRVNGHRVPRLASMCSGSFFLAEAGLLDGKRATTHWNEARAMQARYPQIEVDAQLIIVRQDNIFTSAGVTSGIDLALAIVEDHLGREVALSVARDLVVYLKRPGWQSQHNMHLTSQMSCDPAMRELQEWMISSLDEPLNLERLAAQAGSSPEVFEARFLAHTGITYQGFIETARFELARALTEDSDLPLALIAMRSGLVDAGHMTEVFMQRVGVDPESYRRRFRQRSLEVRTSRRES